MHSPGPRAGRRAGWRRAAAWGALLVVLAGLLALPTLPLGGSLVAGQRAAVASVGTAPASSPTIDWTTFHGSENRSGLTPFAGPVTSHLQTELAPPGTLPIRSGAVANATEVFVANDLGTVFAYNVSVNHSRVWSTSL